MLGAPGSAVGPPTAYRPRNSATRRSASSASEHMAASSRRPNWPKQGAVSAGLRGSLPPLSPTSDAPQWRHVVSASPFGVLQLGQRMSGRPLPAGGIPEKTAVLAGLLAFGEPPRGGGAVL